MTGRAYRPATWCLLLAIGGIAGCGAARVRPGRSAPVGAAVRVRWQAPQDLVVEQGGSDTVALRGVREARGRVRRAWPDSLTLALSAVRAARSGNRGGAGELVAAQGAVTLRVEPGAEVRVVSRHPRAAEGGVLVSAALVVLALWALGSIN